MDFHGFGFGFEWIWMDLHPQLGLLCGAALPGAFFSRKNTSVCKNMANPSKSIQIHFQNCAELTGALQNRGLQVLMVKNAPKRCPMVQ